MFLLSFMFINLVLFMVFFLVMFLISDHSYLVKEKILPFECGMENFKMIRVPFSMQFFFIGIIFVLFDMEILFLIHFSFFSVSFFYFFWWLYFCLFSLFLFITLLVEWKWDSFYWVF